MFTMTGKLLRITTFTASGTWTKKDDVGSILIKAVGAGGTRNANGGNTSIAGMTAGGGLAGVNGGGPASGGDINISGTPYIAASYSNGSTVTMSYIMRGMSSLQGYGNGALPFYAAGSGNPGGGGGGYCEKFISNPLSNYPVTVGQHSGDTARGSTSGIVIIYEFAK